MPKVWKLEKHDDGNWLMWGEQKTARFADDLVTEEMERVVESLNEHDFPEGIPAAA